MAETLAARVTAAAQIACLLDAMAPKPGNVSRGRDLPGLTYRDLVVSATAIGPAFRRLARGRVGRLILQAVRNTHRQVGTNTNLGIVLLLAPLAKAALAGGPVSTRGSARRPGAGMQVGAMRASVRRVLSGLDRRDARDAYRAIRLARPGGLGRVGDQDVSRPPGRSLLDCMRLAAGRDAIAREYATGYATTFTLALPALRRLRERHVPIADAIAQTYLTILAAVPDTLIARKRGEAAARAVSRSTAAALRAGGLLSDRGRRLTARLDARLRRARPPLNPGTTADLTVAALFLWLLSGEDAPDPAPRRRRRRAPRAPTSSGRRRRRPARRAEGATHVDVPR